MLWRLCLLSFAAAAQAPIHFENKASEAGVKFVLENSPTPRKHLVETMPGGVAVFDYNSDERPDIFFTNGAALPSMEKNSKKFHNRLFRNDGNWKFKDVTKEAGLDLPLQFTHGVAVFDYDNDGWPDILLTGYNRLMLLHNEPAPDGKGRRFVDVTQKAGLTEAMWSSCAAWGFRCQPWRSAWGARPLPARHLFPARARGSAPARCSPAHSAWCRCSRLTRT